MKGLGRPSGDPTVTLAESDVAAVARTDCRNPLGAAAAMGGTGLEVVTPSLSSRYPSRDISGPSPTFPAQETIP